MAQDDKLALEREILDVKEENALLRSREGQVDPQTLESEVQRRLIDYMGPIKGKGNVLFFFFQYYDIFKDT